MVRQRHPPGGATSRPTHTTGQPDYASPSNRMYGSEMDIEALTVVDLGKGSVTTGAIDPGGLDGSTAITPGTLPPTAGDTTPPGLPSTVTVTSELLDDATGASAPAIKVSMMPPPDVDYFATYIEATENNDNDPVTPSPVWTRPIIVVSGRESSIVYVTGVAGLTQYWVRMRTADTQGNISAYGPTYPVMTVADTVPPDIPQAVDSASGFKAIGVRWASAAPSDLMFFEVRYAPDLSGAPNTALWVTRRTASNYIYIDDLAAPVSYWAQVRAIDYSHNVAARWSVTGLASTDVLTCVDHTFTNGQIVALSDFTGGAGLETVDTMYVVNATATTFQISVTPGGAVFNFTTNLSGFVSMDALPSVNYLDEPEAGWSILTGPVQAGLVGAADLALNSLISNMISTGIIDASTIQTGLLKIASNAGATADGIQIVYNGSVVGDWDETGLNIRSKVAGRRTLDYIHLDGSSMYLYADGVYQTAITKDGINATVINFGVAEGGHNLIFNSSFELSAFVQTSTAIIGSGGSTLAGAVGGWVLVSNTNCTLAAASVTVTAF